VDALDRANQSELAKGTVLTIDNAIDTTTGTVKIRSSFANRDYRLFPNEFVNARLLLKTLRKVNLIPTAAIQRNNDIAFVYVVDENNAVKLRNIKIATTDANTAAVTGVNPGEKLVTDGFDRLQDGVKVVVRSSGIENPQSPATPQDQTGAAGAPNKQGPANNAAQGQGAAPRANSR
jgi:multidrug efflux system membrane fusion protein